MKIVLLTALILFSTTYSLGLNECLEDKAIQIYDKGLEKSEESAKELFTLVQEFVSKKENLDSLKVCMNEKLSFLNGVLLKIGETFLYETNCTKDIGATFLFADSFTTGIEKKDWQSAIVGLIGTITGGKQSYSDCSAAIQAIIQIWGGKNLR